MRSLVCLTVLLASACETSPSAVRHQHIEAERETFVYTDPPDRLYAFASELLAEKGFEMPPGPPALNRSISSAHQKKGDGATQRFVVRLIPTAGGHLVHIIGISADKNGEVYFRSRWDELEWELIQRAEPYRATEISRTARRKADDVHRRQRRRPRL